MDLFENIADDRPISMEKNDETFLPLAARMRPSRLEDFVGQKHILSEGKLLWRLIKSDRIGAMIFYGPAGTGKTTLANIISKTTGSRFVRVNAVTSNVAELRQVVESAKKNFSLTRQRTILFVDEIHHFNRSQQDILLPDIENNAVGFIGATTHNPSFALTAPLVSRSRVFQFEMLSADELVVIIKRVILNGFQEKKVQIEDDVLNQLALLSDGDARKALNVLDIAVLSGVADEKGVITITQKDVEESTQKKFLSYDRDGDGHYDTVSAFIKSMRGSDPDAAVYWLAKMLDAGEDPRFIARRIVICASEDVGNADPMAIMVAISAFHALEFIGLPEARLALTQAVLYIATAPKSNSTTKAIDSALAALREKPVERVPDHLRDAHYYGARRFGAGIGYLYPHDYPGHFVRQEYRIGKERFYIPSDQGVEKEISERLARWTQLAEKSISEKK